MNDYAEFEERDVVTAASESALGKLAEFAARQVLLEREVAQREEELSKAKKALADVQERELPQLMDELNMSKFETADGLVVAVTERLRGGIKKGQAEPAFEFLESHGQANSIKRQFVVDFGVEEEKWARRFAADLRRRKRQLNVKDVKDIHPSTLLSVLQQMLDDGVDVPLNTFGVYRQRRSKVTSKD